MKRILVLCTGNSCRSQMAEGYLRHFANGEAEIYSAGVEMHGLNQDAVSIMREDGIDIAHHTSNLVDEYAHLDFDFIITVCDNANERCPFFPGKAQRFHQNFCDPSKVTGSPERQHATFVKTRDAIKAYSQEFIAAHL